MVILCKRKLLDKGGASIQKGLHESVGLFWFIALPIIDCFSKKSITTIFTFSTNLSTFFDVKGGSHYEYSNKYKNYETKYKTVFI